MVRLSVGGGRGGGSRDEGRDNFLKGTLHQPKDAEVTVDVVMPVGPLGDAFGSSKSGIPTDVARGWGGNIKANSKARKLLDSAFGEEPHPASLKPSFLPQTHSRTKHEDHDSSSSSDGYWEKDLDRNEEDDGAVVNLHAYSAQSHKELSKFNNKMKGRVGNVAVQKDAIFLDTTNKVRTTISDHTLAMRLRRMTPKH